MAAPALLSPPPMDEDGAAPPAPAAPDSVPPPPPPEPKPPLLRQRPPVRVTSEFDSERRLFSHRFSCRVLDGLAKLRLRVSHGAGGGGIAWGPPDVALLAKNFSVIVDPASRGVVLRGATDLAGSLRLRASHNTKNCQSGEQSYIHVGCSAHCLSVSCNYEYDKSIVSCIHLDRCFQFKYHSRKDYNLQSYILFFGRILIIISISTNNLLKVVIDNDQLPEFCHPCPVVGHFSTSRQWGLSGTVECLSVSYQQWRTQRPASAQAPGQTRQARSNKEKCQSLQIWEIHHARLNCHLWFLLMDCQEQLSSFQKVKFQ